jgi:C1A family cysteine protease
MEERMTELFKVGGHLADPVNPKYRNFESISGLLMGSGSGDADLRMYSSEVHNQRQTGSCVANAVAKALEIKERHEKASNGEPMSHTDISRLHLYFLSREMHRAQGEDNGTHISICCDVLNRFGIVSEKYWPFDINKLFVPPSWKAMRHCYSNKLGLSGYYRIESSGSDRVNDVVKALRANHPVVFGTQVDTRWFGYKSGEVLKPVSESEGAHATCLVGWDEARSLVIGENSWGPHWGDNGCYLMDPKVLESWDSSDFWVIRGHWQDSPK